MQWLQGSFTSYNLHAAFSVSFSPMKFNVFQNESGFQALGDAQITCNSSQTSEFGESHLHMTNVQRFFTVTSRLQNCCLLFFFGIFACQTLQMRSTAPPQKRPYLCCIQSRGEISGSRFDVSSFGRSPRSNFECLKFIFAS